MNSFQYSYSESEPCSFKLKEIAMFDLSKQGQNTKVNENLPPPWLDLHFKSVNWCPEGSQLLTNSGDNVLRVFDCKSSADSEQALKLKQKYLAEQTVLSTQWYPYKTINGTKITKKNPVTCCYLASTREQPIKLLDSNSCLVRAKYKAHDDKDELLTAYSCKFNNSGDKIYAGFWERIAIFDSQSPGKPVCVIKTSPSRKSIEGQKGIVSCIEFPSPASHNYGKVFATATFSGNISLWDERSGTLSGVWTVDPSASKPKGITSLCFSPDGNYIFAGARKSNTISCWDVRYISAPISSFTRQSDTQQRIGFVVDSNQGYLISGNTDGSVWFNTLSPNMGCAQTDKFFLHKDIVCDISMHPFSPVLATVSGQRHFNVAEPNNSCALKSDPEFQLDSSLKIWDISSKDSA